MNYREHQGNLEGLHWADVAEDAAWAEIRRFIDGRMAVGDYDRCQDVEDADAARIARDGLDGMPDWMRQSMPPERRT